MSYDVFCLVVPAKVDCILGTICSASVMDPILCNFSTVSAGTAYI